MEDIINIVVLLVLGAIGLGILGVILSFIQWIYEKVKETFFPDKTVFGGKGNLDEFGKIDTSPFKPAKKNETNVNANVFIAKGRNGSEQQEPNVSRLQNTPNGSPFKRAKKQINEEAIDWVTGQPKKTKKN